MAWAIGIHARHGGPVVIAFTRPHDRVAIVALVPAVVADEAVRAIPVAGEALPGVVRAARCVVAVVLAVTRCSGSLPRHPCGDVLGPATLACSHGSCTLLIDVADPPVATGGRPFFFVRAMVPRLHSAQLMRNLRHLREAHDGHLPTVRIVPSRSLVDST